MKWTLLFCYYARGLDLPFPILLALYAHRPYHLDNDGGRFVLLHQEEPHCLYAPAVCWTNGRKEWWRNGKLHRDDGPAIEDADGSLHWFKAGQRHRSNGPAIEWPTGRCDWYTNGIPFRVSFRPT